jgi:hypothetical protein
MTRLWTRAVLAAIVVLAVAGCGSAAPASSGAPSSAPASSAPASQAATASASASASPSAAASAATSAAVDPMDDISVAVPYALAPLDEATASTFENQMKTGLGALGSLINVGARTVTNTGAPAGIVIAMSFPGIPGTELPTFLDSVALGAAGSAQGKTTSRTIDGQDVKVIETERGSFALYKHGTDTVVMTVGQTTDQAVAIITAIISATE